MKGNKGIIKHQQNNSSRNSDDDKLDQIGTALVNIGINNAIDSIHIYKPSIFSIGRNSRIKLYFFNPFSLIDQNQILIYLINRLHFIV